jgi:hypothetical protein
MTAHLLLATALTVAAGLAMLRLGLRHNVLAVRSSSRRCASCRRRIETPYCPHCTR